jgi:aminocarboxymuconate-semialdehyde decarboxylase
MTLGLSGAQLGTNVNGRNLEEFFPVFEAAQDLGASLFVHPWDMMGQDQMAKYWLPWLVGMPAELSRAICSLIFGGVLEKLPKLRLAFAHGGGSFGCTLGRVAHGFAARPDLCAVDNKRDPREYMGRFWVDSLVHDPAVLRHLIDLFGERRIVLGTDFPFPLGEQRPGALIESMKISSPLKRRLLWDNAMTWLGRE